MSQIIPIHRDIKPQDLVLRFLSSIGHKRDAEFYLNLFKSKNPESFAIIVLDEETIQHEMDSVIFEIRYLMRLALFPVVVIQAGTAFLETLEVENYLKRTKMAPSFLPQDLSQDDKIEQIKKRIKQRSLPVLHLSPSDDLLGELVFLANQLKTTKVLFLNRTAGIIDQNTKEPVSIINLRFDRDSPLVSDTITPQDKTILKQCVRIIDECQHRVLISITSPNNLLRELFTVKGAGTLVQLGSKILNFENINLIDPKSLRRLLEHSFEKALSDDFFSQDFGKIYIEENYTGAAIIKTVHGLSYLSKFAVGTEARGLGIGRDLWEEILNNHKSIFWRSDPNRFITSWYTKQCDGMHKTPKWTVFWKGVAPSDIPNVIEYAANAPVDLI